MALLTFRDKYVVQSDTLRSFSSASLADDAYATTTVTLSATQTVLVMYQTNNSYGLSGVYYGYTTAIGVDASDYGYCYNRPENNDNYSISGFSYWIGSLAAGTYTIKGRYASNNGGSTSYINNSTLLIYVFDGDEFGYTEDSSNLATTTSPALVNDPYATLSFTPSGDCVALAFYNVTCNNSVASDSYNGKSIAFNIENGAEYMGADRYQVYQSANDNEASHLLTVFGDTMPARPTIIQGRFSCPSGSTASVQRRQIGYLLLDAAYATLDWVSSAVTVQVTSVNATTWKPDTAFTINKTLNAPQNFLAQIVAGRAYGYSGDNHNEGWSYGLAINDALVSYVRHSVYSETKGLNVAVCYGGLIPPGNYSFTGEIAQNTNSFWNSTFTYRHGYVLLLDHKYISDVPGAGDTAGGAEAVIPVPDHTIEGAGAVNYVPRVSALYQGQWTTSTAYKAADTSVPLSPHYVSNLGNVYICIANHTSGSSTEPGVGASWQSYWRYVCRQDSLLQIVELDADLAYTININAKMPTISASMGFDQSNLSVRPPYLWSDYWWLGQRGESGGIQYESYSHVPLPSVDGDGNSTAGRSNDIFCHAPVPQISGSGSEGGSIELSVFLNSSGTGYMLLTGEGVQKLVPSAVGSGTTTIQGNASLEMPAITTSGYSAVIGAIDLPTIDITGTGTVTFTAQSEDLTVGLSVVAAGTVTLYGAGEIKLVSSVSATGTTTLTGNASLGVGGISVGATGVVPISGEGEAEFVGKVIGTGVTTLYGSSSLKLVLGVIAEGYPAVYGECALNPIIGVDGSGTAVIFGYGTQKAVFGSAGTGVVPISGSGSVSIVPQAEGTGTTVLYGEAALEIVPQVYGTGLVPYYASCYLNVRQQVSATGRSTLFGNADLSVLINVNGSKDVANISLEMPFIEVSGSGTVGIVGQGTQSIIFDVSADGLTTILGSASLELPDIDVSSFASSGISGACNLAVFFETSGTGLRGILGSSDLEIFIAATGTGSHGAIGSASVMLMPITVLSGAYDSEDTDNGSAVVFNVVNNAIWNYTNYAFNSFAKMNGYYVGAKDDGLYILTGDLDNGAAIDAVIESGMNNMDSTRMKNVPSIYIAYETDGELKFSTIRDEEKESQEILLNERKNLLHPRRVLLPRGHIAKYFGWQIKNVRGSDFQIDAIDLEVELKKSRLKGK